MFWFADLDVFDFFNVPRLPVVQGGDMGQVQPGTGVPPNLQMPELPNPTNEFNITNFIVDQNSDWLFNNQG